MTRVTSLLLIAAMLSPVAPASASTDGTQTDFMSRHYPSGALERGEDGKVGFSVEVSSEGRIEQCRVTESSGYPTLDRETCDFIVQFAGFGAARDAQGKAYPSTKNGVVTWTLPRGAVRSTLPRIVAATLPEPLLCRRGEKTGSNRAKVTHCMTRAEWALQDNLLRQSLEQSVGRRICTTEGC